MTTQQLVVGATGRKLRHVPLGIASSVSYVLEQLGHERKLISEGSITPPSWSLTTTAIAGVTQVAGARIAVGSTTGASLGAAAVITAPDGTWELFEIKALTVDSYVEAVSTLAGVYPIGSTVRGVELEAPVPDDFGADLLPVLGTSTDVRWDDPIRITWEYTLDGVERRRPELVELVRHNHNADALEAAAVLWITDAYPDLRERMKLRPERAAKLMLDEVSADLRKKGIDPATFLAGDRARQLLSTRVMVHYSDLGYSPTANIRDDWAGRIRRVYENRLDDLTIGSPGHNTAVTEVPKDNAPENPDPNYRFPFRRM